MLDDRFAERYVQCRGLARLDFIGERFFREIVGHRCRCGEIAGFFFPTRRIDRSGLSLSFSLRSFTGCPVVSSRRVSLIPPSFGASLRISDRWNRSSLLLAHRRRSERAHAKLEEANLRNEYDCCKIHGTIRGMLNAACLSVCLHA